MIRPIPGVSRSRITTESWPTEGVNLHFDAQEGVRVRIGRNGDESFHHEGVHVRWISWWEWVNMVHPSVWSIPSRSASSHEEVNEASKNTTSTSGEIGDDYKWHWSVTLCGEVNREWQWTWTWRIRLHHLKEDQKIRRWWLRESEEWKSDEIKLVVHHQSTLCHALNFHSAYVWFMGIVEGTSRN